jgi:type I restriction-modification system DNA methylase subunit
MASGTNVEDSYSSELTGLLKKRGLNATFKKSYNTFYGRKEPDVHIQLSEGIMLLEAKVPPAGLPKAMSQIVDYQKSIGMTENIVGVFAVVYADKQKKGIEIYFQGQVGAEFQKFKTLDQLADYITSKATATPAPVEQISTQKVISILNESVGLLSASLSKASSEEIENIFGGREFFSTVLDYEQELQIPDMALKNAAGYLLVNQLLFYDVLVKETKKYPDIDVKSIKTGDDLQSRYFNLVLRDDYKPVFGFNVAGNIREVEAVEELRTVISTVQLLSVNAGAHDLLGKIFHNLIPLSLRKVVAAYYTNSEAAELLANLAIHDKNDSVFDPACGSGTLLVASYHRKQALYERFSESQHTKFLEHDIVGCDIMPFAAHLAAVNLALQAPLSFTNKVNVIIRDSSELAPGMEVASVQEVMKESSKVRKLTEYLDGAEKKKRGKIKKGVIDLLEDDRGITLSKFDVVIMNPPFTKFQRIPPSFKAKLAQRFSSARYRDIVHGQLGLHGYFLLLADKFLKEGGRLAAVLPLTTISLEGFYGLIKLYLNEYQIEHIVVTTGRSAFSENTSLREMLFVAKKQKPLPESLTKFTFIHASPEDLTVEKSNQIAERITKFEHGEEYNEDFYIRVVNQNNFLKDIRTLYQTVTLHNPELVKIDINIRKWFKLSKTYTTLGEIEEKEKWKIGENPRGVEKKGYYALSLLSKRAESKSLKDHDVWIIEEETAQLLKVKHRFNNQTFKIPRTCVVPQFRRFSGYPYIRLKSPKDYLVIRKFDDLLEFLMASTQADEKLQRSILLDFREGSWEKFVIKNSARIFGFYRGNIAASGTNVMCVSADEQTFAGPGGSWVFHAPQTHDLLTGMWLNSSIVFYYILRDRKETEGGFVELDKYIFLDLPYPNPASVDNIKLEQLEEELSKTEFPSLLQQFQQEFAPRKKIDMFFLNLAGVDEKEAERFLHTLYEELAKELLRLKGVMS